MPLYPYDSSLTSKIKNTESKFLNVFIFCSFPFFPFLFPFFSSFIRFHFKGISNERTRQTMRRTEMLHGLLSRVAVTSGHKSDIIHALSDLGISTITDFLNCYHKIADNEENCKKFVDLLHSSDILEKRKEFIGEYCEGSNVDLKEDISPLIEWLKTSTNNKMKSNNSIINMNQNKRRNKFSSSLKRVHEQYKEYREFEETDSKPSNQVSSTLTSSKKKSTTTIDTNGRGTRIDGCFDDDPRMQNSI